MIFRRTPIPLHWQSDYDECMRKVERQIALVAGWLLVVVTALYQASHNLRNIHGDIYLAETLLKAPVLVAALLTLAAHRTKKLHREPGRFLRAMALSVMCMSLALFLLHAIYSPGTLYQTSNVMMICFFGVSILAVRGFRQWWMFFIIPLLLFFSAMLALGLDITQHMPFLFDPLVMILLGVVVSSAQGQLRRSEFLTRQQFKSLASTDQLTGLLNRHAIHTSFEQLMARHARHGHPFSLVLGDLDKFKRINDSYGHGVGDKVLAETARRLKNHVRTGDIICRWGGEELLILLPDTELHNALAVAEKLRTAIGGTTIRVGSVAIEQTISFGVACYREGEQIDTTILRADSALYMAKQGGRNRVASIEVGAPPASAPTVTPKSA